MLEARTQASVALFKLGAHSATLRPEFGGPKSLRCCCAKGVGHRAQLMLRARRGDRENNHPVPLLRTPTPQNALSLLSSLRGGSQLPSPSTSCHRAQLPQGAAGDAPPQSASTPTRSSPTSAAERAESKQASHCILACSWSAAFCGHEHGGVGAVARIVPAHRPFLPRDVCRPRFDVATFIANEDSLDCRGAPARGGTPPAALADCALLLHGIDPIPQRRCCAGGGRGHAGLDL